MTGDRWWPLRGFALRAVVLCLVGGAVLALVGYRARPAQLELDFAFPWLNQYFRWDAKWYLLIARDGYSYVPGEQGPVAFFPVFPLLVKAVAWTGLPLPIAGVLTSLGCGAGAAWLFAIWARRFTDEAGARAAWTLFFSSPFVFFIAGPVYSDGVFLLVTLGAFLALERRWLVLATLLAAIATAARPVGVAVVAGLWVRQLELQRADGSPWWHWRGFVTWLGMAGLGAWMLYLQQAFGDFLAFAHVQAAWGQLTGWQSFLKYPSLLKLRWWDWGLPLFDGALALGLFALSWPLRRRLGWGYAVYNAVVLGIPLVTAHEFVGLGRYSLAAFPAFLLVVPWLEARPWWKRPVLAGSFLLAAVLLSVFAIGRFVS